MRAFLLVLMLLSIAAPAMAAGAIAIPSQGLYQDSHIKFTEECVAEGIEVAGDIYLNWYHRKPDFSDEHQAVSVSVNDEQPFAWGIIPEGEDEPIFYVDADRDGMAELTLPWSEALDRYDRDWCVVYREIRHGRP